jgi:hypothetical protein
MRAWYTDADGGMVTVNTDIKGDLTLDESFAAAQEFVNNNQTV